MSEEEYSEGGSGGNWLIRILIGFCCVLAVVAFLPGIDAAYGNDVSKAISFITQNGYTVYANGDLPGSALVGISDNQTLSNKTYQGGSVSGNFVPTTNNTRTLGNSDRWFNYVWTNTVRAINGIFDTLNTTQLNATTGNVTQNLTAGNLTVSQNTSLNYTTLAGDIVPTSNNTRNLGYVTRWFANLWANLGWFNSINATTVNGTQGTFATFNLSALTSITSSGTNHYQLFESGVLKLNYLIGNGNEWQYYQDWAGVNGTYAPFLNLLQMAEGGEAVIRFSRTAGTLTPVANETWIVGVPPDATLGGHSHFHINRDGNNDAFTIDENGRVVFGASSTVNSSQHGWSLVGVRGYSDIPQFVVQGFSTQTNDIFQIKNSNNNTLLSVTNNLTLLGVSGLGFEANPTTKFYYVGPGSIGVANNLRIDSSLKLGGNPSGVAGLAELPTVISTSVNSTTVNTTQLRLTPIATPSGVAGYMYYDSTNNTLLFYNGTTWKIVQTN